MGAEKYDKYKPPNAKQRHRDVRNFSRSLEPPEAPAPTEQELALQARQREAMASLDDQENIRLKRGLRGQQGTRRLLSAVRRTSGAGGSIASPTASMGGMRTVSPSRSSRGSAKEMRTGGDR